MRWLPNHANGNQGWGRVGRMVRLDEAASGRVHPVLLSPETVSEHQIFNGHLTSHIYHGTSANTFGIQMSIISNFSRRMAYCASHKFDTPSHPQRSVTVL